MAPKALVKKKAPPVPLRRGSSSMKKEKGKRVDGEGGGVEAKTEQAVPPTAKALKRISSAESASSTSPTPLPPARKSTSSSLMSSASFGPKGKEDPTGTSLKKRGSSINKESPQPVPLKPKAVLEKKEPPPEKVEERSKAPSPLKSMKTSESLKETIPLEKQGSSMSRHGSKDSPFVDMRQAENLKLSAAELLNHLVASSGGGEEARAHFARMIEEELGAHLVRRGSASNINSNDTVIGTKAHPESSPLGASNAASAPKAALAPKNGASLKKRGSDERSKQEINRLTEELERAREDVQILKRLVNQISCGRIPLAVPVDFFYELGRRYLEQGNLDTPKPALRPFGGRAGDVELVPPGGVSNCPAGWGDWKKQCMPMKDPALSLPTAGGIAAGGGLEEGSKERPCSSKSVPGLPLNKKGTLSTTTGPATSSNGASSQVPGMDIGEVEQRIRVEIDGGDPMEWRDVYRMNKEGVAELQSSFANTPGRRAMIDEKTADPGSGRENGSPRSNRLSRLRTPREGGINVFIPDRVDDALGKVFRRSQSCTKDNRAVWPQAALAQNLQMIMSQVCEKDLQLGSQTAVIDELRQTIDRYETLLASRGPRQGGGGGGSMTSGLDESLPPAFFPFPAGLEAALLGAGPPAGISCVIIEDIDGSMSPPRGGEGQDDKKVEDLDSIIELQTTPPEKKLSVRGGKWEKRIDPAVSYVHRRLEGERTPGWSCARRTGDKDEGESYAREEKCLVGMDSRGSATSTKEMFLSPHVDTLTRICVGEGGANSSEGESDGEETVRQLFTISNSPPAADGKTGTAVEKLSESPKKKGGQSLVPANAATTPRKGRPLTPSGSAVVSPRKGLASPPSGSPAASPRRTVSMVRAGSSVAGAGKGKRSTSSRSPSPAVPKKKEDSKKKTAGGTGTSSTLKGKGKATPRRSPGGSKAEVKTENKEEEEEEEVETKMQDLSEDTERLKDVEMMILQEVLKVKTDEETARLISQLYEQAFGHPLPEVYLSVFLSSLPHRRKGEEFTERKEETQVQHVSPPSTSEVTQEQKPQENKVQSDEGDLSRDRVESAAHFPGQGGMTATTPKDETSKQLDDLFSPVNTQTYDLTEGDSLTSPVLMKKGSSHKSITSSVRGISNDSQGLSSRQQRTGASCFICPGMKECLGPSSVRPSGLSPSASGVVDAAEEEGDRKLLSPSTYKSLLSTPLSPASPDDVPEPGTGSASALSPEKGREIVVQYVVHESTNKAKSGSQLQSSVVADQSVLNGRKASEDLQPPSPPPSPVHPLFPPLSCLGPEYSAGGVFVPPSALYPYGISMDGFLLAPPPPSLASPVKHDGEERSREGSGGERGREQGRKEEDVKRPKPALRAGEALSPQRKHTDSSSEAMKLDDRRSSSHGVTISQDISYLGSPASLSPDVKAVGAQTAFPASYYQYTACATSPSIVLVPPLPAGTIPELALFQAQSAGGAAPRPNQEPQPGCPSTTSLPAAVSSRSSSPQKRGSTDGHGLLQVPSILTDQRFVGRAADLGKSTEKPAEAASLPKSDQTAAAQIFSDPYCAAFYLKQTVDGPSHGSVPSGIPTFGEAFVPPGSIAWPLATTESTDISQKLQRETQKQFLEQLYLRQGQLPLGGASVSPAGGEDFPLWKSPAWSVVNNVPGSPYLVSPYMSPPYPASPPPPSPQIGSVEPSREASSLLTRKTFGGEGWVLYPRVTTQGSSTSSQASFPVLAGSTVGEGLKKERKAGSVSVSRLSLSSEKTPASGRAPSRYRSLSRAGSSVSDRRSKSSSARQGQPPVKGAGGGLFASCCGSSEVLTYRISVPEKPSPGRILKKASTLKKLDSLKKLSTMKTDEKSLSGVTFESSTKDSPPSASSAKEEKSSSTLQFSIVTPRTEQALKRAKSKGESTDSKVTELLQK
ncbi:hypothetical protein CSUI_003179, partial [Cystoisospora suis]